MEKRESEAAVILLQVEKWRKKILVHMGMIGENDNENDTAC